MKARGWCREKSGGVGTMYRDDYCASRERSDSHNQPSEETSAAAEGLRLISLWAGSRGINLLLDAYLYALSL